MNLGVWAMIVAILVKLWSVFRGGEGYRATVEVRPEAAIVEEKAKLDRLRRSLKEKKGELDKTTIQECTARANGLKLYADTVVYPRVRELQQEYWDRKQEYIAAGGLPFKGW